MPAPDLRRELALVTRFAGAGVITTAVGLGVILALDVGLGVDPHVANACGYLVGVLLSLVLQKRFVFRHEGSMGAVGLRFLLVIGIAFAVNQAVLYAAGLIMPPGKLGHTAAQVLAMGSYTATQFVLFRLWVFGPAR